MIPDNRNYCGGLLLSVSNHNPITTQNLCENDKVHTCGVVWNLAACGELCQCCEHAHVSAKLG